jgi:photosystem II stability/assembly factor-like uncharacterized protein
MKLGLPILALVVLIAAGIALQPPAGPRAVIIPADFGVQDREEYAELTEPATAMLQRQFSGDDIAPTDVIDKAIARSRRLQAQTQREAPAVARAQWDLVGPTNIGGRILDIAIDPVVSDQIFVASASGGVWKSDDAGKTFSSVWPVDETQAIGALAITPSGILYAGTGETGPGGGSMTYGGRGVFRSDDRGKTWKRIGLENTSRIGRIVVDPGNERRIWVAASGNLFKGTPDRGLYRSDDGGATWKKVLAGDNDTTGAADVAVDPKNPKNVIATLWDHKRGPNEHRYYGGGSGIFRSTDGGETWERTGGATLGTQPTLGRIGVAYAPSDPDVVYAIAQIQTGRYLGLYKSLDGGETWTGPALDDNIITASASFGWWFGRVWVTPDDPLDVWVAGVSLIRSRDGGTTTAVVANEVHADQHAMAWDPKVADRIYLGNDGGVYRSDDDGGSWSFNEYLPASQLYSLDVSEQDRGMLVAGLQDNGVNLKTPDSEGWTSYGGGDGERTLIKPTDKDIVYGCSQYGNCFVDRSGGGNTDRTNFTQRVVSARKNWFTPIEFDPEDPSIVYTGGEIMSRSTDDGETWTPISPDLSNGLQPDPDPDYRNYGSLTTIGPAGKSTGIIYAGTDDGNLWVTQDDGGSWTQVSQEDLPNAWITRVQPDPRDPKTAYVTYSGFRSGDEPAYLFKTTDAGASWKNITGDLPAAPLNDVNVIGDILVVASDVGVFASRDGGEKWLKIGFNLPLAPVHELRYIPQDDALYVATFGRSLWKVKMPKPSDFDPGAALRPGGGSGPASAKRRLAFGKKVRFTRGALRVPVSCRSTTRCRGTLSVAVAKKTLGRRTFSLPAGRTRTVVVRAKGAKLRALRRAKRVTLRATLRADASGPGGRFSATRRK